MNKMTGVLRQTAKRKIGSSNDTGSKRSKSVNGIVIVFEECSMMCVYHVHCEIQI